MNEFKNNIITILIISSFLINIFQGCTTSTPQEKREGIKKILSQYFYVKGAGEMCPPENNGLSSIANFLATCPLSIGKSEIRMLRNNFYYGNLVADVLESGSYKMTKDYVNKKAPYDPDNFEYYGTKQKLLREVKDVNYKFYTVKLISKGKNQWGVDTTGREVYMFLFFDEDNDFIGEIIAMK
jgi:hypothetical protein